MTLTQLARQGTAYLSESPRDIDDLQFMALIDLVTEGHLTLGREWNQHHRESGQECMEGQARSLPYS